MNAANDNGETPLSLSVQSRNAALVEKLLKAGANPNVAKPSGETALMTAARVGAGQVVMVLTARGANVNARETMKGQTALMWAVARKHLPVVEALLAAGADVNAASTGGSTALHFAVQQGDVAAAKLLLPAGADTNATMTVRQIDDVTQPYVETVENITPLSLAITICQAEVPRQGDVYRAAKAFSCPRQEELGAALLDSGANANVADGSGIPILHSAVRARMTNLVKALLAHGATPNVQVPKTAVRQAPEGHVLSLKLFFALPVGATPFYVAAQTRNPELMRVLLAAGADPQIPADDKTTPLMVAAGVAARGT